MYKIQKINIKRKGNAISKWANELNTFQKKKQMANKLKMLHIFSHQENANQNYIEIAPHPKRMATLISQQTKADKHEEEKELFYTAGGTIN
jgi:hypothetical protein